MSEQQKTAQPTSPPAPVVADATKLAQAQQQVVASAVQSASGVQQMMLDYAESIPSNWAIYPTEKDGEIRAENRVTQRQFSGTVAQFNKMLRGE